MHFLTVDCDTFSNEEKVAVVVPVTSVEVEVTCSETMLALSFSTLFLMCLKKDWESQHYGILQNFRWMSI